ncbi:MAG: ABC transporter ATP-binding protein [Hellea sp.]|nr:ABC transporter ATP-binding protein [Hellea sp.]
MSLTAREISAGYGKADIIRDISVSAKPGHLIALIGPNGSGKSTLIKTLAGLLPLSSGDIQLGDQDLGDYTRREAAKKIAYLAQERRALPAMTPADILELGRAPFRGRLGKISAAGHDAIKSAVKAANIAPLMHRRFGELSGGEQARVLMARALSVDAPIILTDEPIAALDPYYQLVMMDILKAEAARGKVVIAALHDLALAYQFADRIWVMDQGQLAVDDVPHRALSEDILARVFKISAEFPAVSTSLIEI